ncbi:TIGR02391 family protein [Pseudanabaena sp. lw0831]|uniref:TIGR02391 family protein n=1 Tax=Pseudanabaena sp. lw0831 TaxID=1357935 RepID=UPI001915F312|nr:TIGR02391 family protein [Pseudanabaena sp. lw0831]
MTDSQKKIAKWLVQSVRTGLLDEEFTIEWHPTAKKGLPKAKLSGYRGTEEELQSTSITLSSMQALISNKLIIYSTLQLSRRSYVDYTCSTQPRLNQINKYNLTGNIYTAVDNDFNSPDTSFVDYLTPLSNPSDFDEALTKRCFPILATGGSDPILWDSAVRTAGVILEERLHDVGAISDPSQVGRSLVNAIFGKTGTLASKFAVDAEREGYRELYSGIVGTFRNLSAHRLIDPSPEEGGAFIIFVNLLLKKLEDLR